MRRIKTINVNNLISLFVDTYTMVRQELPKPNACGHYVRPVNMAYMLIGNSDLKQEARLFVTE